MSYWCWVNQVNAAAATQQMVDFFDIKGIVHFGIAGNVNDSLSIGDVTVPKQIAHTGIWDWQVHIYLSSLYNLVSLLIFIYVFFFSLVDQSMCTSSVENSFC